MKRSVGDGLKSVPVYTKRLADIHSDLERGVFLCVYNSRQQHWRRLVAGLILGIKHGVRGAAFSWPLYLLPLAAVMLDRAYWSVVLLLLLPGIYVSGLILLRGVREASPA